MSGRWCDHALSQDPFLPGIAAAGMCRWRLSFGHVVVLSTAW